METLSFTENSFLKQQEPKERERSTKKKKVERKLTNK